MIALAAAALPPQEIVAPGPQGHLKGSLTRTEDPDAPVVLIIPGSGPTDRDGNNPLGVNAGSYRLLAEGLAAAGVSTVRIDKRGMFGSAYAVPDANGVTINDYVEDVRAWIQVIRDTTGTDCVWLLGHSEGGLVALATAQDKDEICGVVLIATPGRPLGNVLKEQLHANPANAELLLQADAAIDALAAGRRVDSTNFAEPLAALFAPAIQDFLISAFTLDPAQLIKNISKPILILQGEADLQVGMPDAEALADAAPSAQLIGLPDTNHVLKTVAPNDTAANIATYTNPNLPLAPDVIKSILNFVDGHGGTK